MNREILAAVTATFVISCTASIQPETTVTYIHPEPGQLRQLAILPVSAGEGLEGFRRLTADSLRVALERHRSGMEIVPASESLGRLSDAGLAETYSKMVQDYDRTGVLDRDRLQEISDAVGANYMLRTSVDYGTSVSGGGIYETERQNLNIFARIWSAEHGDIVWEANSTVRVEAGWGYGTRNLRELVSIACSEIARQVPRELGGS